MVVIAQVVGTVSTLRSQFTAECLQSMSMHARPQLYRCAASTLSDLWCKWPHDRPARRRRGYNVA
jgi:hypothetical protein